MVANALRAVLQLTLIALVCGVAGVRCSAAPPADAAAPGGLLGELARSGIARTIAPRLSIPSAYRACTQHAPPDGTIPQTECEADSTATASTDRTLDLAARASAQVRAEVDPGALHTVALIDLLWADGAGNSLQRSISYLESASRLADRPAPVLADLAAAYLVRAERTQNPRDLLEAIEAAEGALALEPRSEAARFNLALALDRFGLDGQATEAWREFLMVDSISGWAAEVRDRLQALAGVQEPPPPPAPGAPASEIAAWVEGAPQEALQFGWEEALGRWGTAINEGNRSHAAAWLQLAGALGEALEGQGGDATLADAVRRIRMHTGEPKATLVLARAHQEYALGRAAYQVPNFEEAHDHFTAVIAAAPASEPLLQWTRMGYAATLAYQGQAARSESLLTRLVAQVDSLRDPGLAGRVHATLGSVLYRSSRYEEALPHFQDGVRLLARSREREQRGAVEGIVADLQFTTGDEVMAYRQLHRALGTLRPYRRSHWLHIQLYVAAEETAAAGLLRAALRLQDEGVSVAERLGKPSYVAEARLARARLRAAAGDTLPALEDVGSGERALAALEPGYWRSYGEAELRLTRAVLTPAGNGGDPVLLDPVVAFFEERQIPLRLLPALVARADARLTHGQVEAAQADLDRAAALLEAQRDAITRTPLRASLMDAARAVFDRVVMLHVESGRPAEALAHLQRGRAGVSPYPRRDAQAAEGRLAAPAGEVAVEYALIGDDLLIWTVLDTAVHLTRTRVDRRELLRTIERTRASLELYADTTARASLAVLHDWLVRPIEQRLGPEGTPLVVIADGEIAAVPFAALLDRRRDRYLVERHPLRFASSLHHAAAQRPPPGEPAGAALLVADPAFDPREHPGLPRLPGSRSEVARLAAGYPQPVILEGADANRTALLESLPRSTIIHYAGHAVFDDERPERSYLVLAPEGERPGGGRVSAAEIEGLDLRRVRLVVLSACQTLTSRATRSGGFAGFANALFAAGAGGVVGSLWRVDDWLTQPLMSEFHRAFAVSGDGAAALRHAQLALLRSPDPALRSPGAWAGFRYAGR